MDHSTREPVKLIPCELCGSEAKLLCFCRKCSLCESCIGKHLISEPTLAHKPVTFSQSEIAAQYEREFSEIREHEQRLMQEVSQRQEENEALKARLKQESQRLEQFKCTCLEYVALAVEVATQKLAQSAEVIGREMVEKCQAQNTLLEEASLALENGEDHHYLASLRKGSTALLDYKIDLKDVNPESLLRAGIDFRLEPLVSKTVPTPEPKPVVTGIPRTTAKRNTRPSESSIPTPKSAATKNRTDSTRISQSIHKRPSTVRVPEETKQPKQSTKQKVPDIDVDPSPGPPLMRYQTETPGNNKSESFAKTERSQLLYQTAKNVLEMSAMVESLRTPKESTTTRESSFFAARKSSKSPHDYDGSPTSADVKRGIPRLSLQPGFTAGFSLLSSARKQAEEEKQSQAKACLITVMEGSPQLIVHDLALQTSELKSFEGIDPFLKGTFYCMAGLQVFILGGVGSEALPSTIKKCCWIFSPLSDTMEQGPSMHISRYNCSAVCFKDCVFVTGGIGIETSALKDCERMDLKTRKWRKVGNLNVSRESHAMAEHVGRLYVAGGPGASPFETYNPVNDRWALLNIKINATGKATMFSADDRLVVLHEKSLTFAWLDKRNSQDAQELPERGWWTGGVPVRHEAAVYLVRGASVYAYDFATAVLSQVEGWPCFSL